MLSSSTELSLSGGGAGGVVTGGGGGGGVGGTCAATKLMIVDLAIRSSVGKLAVGRVVRDSIPKTTKSDLEPTACHRCGSFR